MSARTERAGREPEHPLVGVIHSAEYLALFHAWAEQTGTWIEIKPWQRESDAAGIAKGWLTATLERDGVTLPELADAVQHRGPELTRYLVEFHRLTRGLPDPEQSWAPDEQPDAEELAELARDEANARPAPAHPAVLLFLICPFLALDRSPDVMPASVLMLAKRERAPQVKIMLAARAAAAVEPTS